MKICQIVRGRFGFALPLMNLFMKADIKKPNDSSNKLLPKIFALQISYQTQLIRLLVITTNITTK